MVAVSIRIVFIKTKWQVSLVVQYSCFSDVHENANPSNQGVFVRAFTCGCIRYLMCIKCLQRNDSKKCIAIYYHVQNEVLPLKNIKTHVIELRGLLSTEVGNLVASWVHRVLFHLIVCLLKSFTAQSTGFVCLSSDFIVQ